MAKINDGQIIIPIDGSLSLNDVKHLVLIATLKKNHGCRSWTAKSLKISLRTVRNYLYYLESVGVEIPEYDTGAVS